jgi:hypothetical protein
MNNPEIISFARLARFDVQALKKELQAFLHKDWVEHVNKVAYDSGWDVIPLRCAAAHIQSHPILQSYQIEGINNWVNLPGLDGCPAILAVLDYLQCHIHAVRLMRLHPGAHIKPHRDKGLCMDDGSARLHVPIETHQQLQFYVNQRRVPMAAGELWYINADQIHEVNNRGNQHRINLVIDCAANDWLKNNIRQSAASVGW